MVKFSWSWFWKYVASVAVFAVVYGVIIAVTFKVMGVK